jgi:hypothetical protein
VQIEEGYTKAMKQFVKLAAKWGAKPVKTTGKHLKFRDALGNQISAPKTSSDWRALKNFKSELKNRGFVQNVPQSKVAKDKVVPTLTTTVQQPTRRTANQGTTFKDFMDKVRSQVTDEKKPSTVASRMAKGWRRAIKELPASEKFRVGDDVIRQLRREAYSQAERQSHVKPRPVDVETVTRKAKDMGKNFYYKDVLPNDKLRHNTPIIPTNKTKSNRGLEV